MEYLRPTKYFVLSLTRLYKFLSLLSKFTNLECDSDIPKIISLYFCLYFMHNIFHLLQNQKLTFFSEHYLEKNLENQEELLLSRIDERFPKTFVTVITKPILNDFYNTNNFFIEYSKHKEMHETSEMF